MLKEKNIFYVRKPKKRYWRAELIDIILSPHTTRNFRKSTDFVIPTPFWGFSLFYALFAQLTGRNLTLNMTYSEYISQIDNYGKGGKFTFLFERFLIQSAKRVVVDTQTFVNIYSRLYSVKKDRFSVMYTFIGDEFYQPTNGNIKTYDFVYHGGFIDNHGVKEFLKGMKYYSESYNRKCPRVLFIGGGKGAFETFNFAKQIGLNTTRLKFNFQHVPLDSIPSYLNKCRFYIGSFGSNLKAQAVLRGGMLEAMACGLPPLVLETYEVNEKIPSTVRITVLENSPEMIAEGIKKCMDMNKEDYFLFAGKVTDFIKTDFSTKNVKSIQDQILNHYDSGSKKNWWKAFFLGLLLLYLRLIDIRTI